MGVYIHLDIDPARIDRAEWADCFDETLRLLRAHPSRLMGFDSPRLFGSAVPVYSRDIERDRGGRLWRWTVCGDRQTLRRAECFELRRDLAAYPLSPRPPCEDLLWLVAQGENRGPTRVFDQKTQGEPYHFAVLGAAMVIEGRFPRHALVSGDIDNAQALRAQRWVEQTLGRPVPLPVRVDREALLKRLTARLSGFALTEAFANLYLGDTTGKGTVAAVVRTLPAEDAERWFAEQLRQQDLGRLGSVRMLLAWLDAPQDLGRLCELACLDPRGPRWEPAAFARALAFTWVGIPRERTSFLDAFRKPEGEAPTVNSLLGAALLDSDTLGRELETRLPPEEVERCLLRVLGARGAAAAVAFRETTATIEAELEEPRAAFPAFEAYVDAQCAQDEEDLAVLESADELTERWRQALQTLAWTARRLLRKLERTKRLLPKPVLDDLGQCRAVLARMHERGPVLTEDAWEHIGAEPDLYTMQLLVALASLDELGTPLLFAQLKRAVFENAAIRRYVVEASRDRKLMARVGAQARRAKKRY